MVFSKHHTNVAKGVAVILMLYHHLITDFPDFPFALLLGNGTHLQFWGNAARGCVAVFVFLTTHNITLQLRDRAPSCAEPSRAKNITRYLAKRYFTLMLGFWWIYLIVVAIDLCFGGGQLTSVYGNDARSIVFVLFDFLGISWAMNASPSLSIIWWYMSLAQFVLFSFPLFFAWFRKAGWFSVALAFMLQPLLPVIFSSSFNYFVPILLGIAFASANAFEKISKWQVFPKRKTAILSETVKILIAVLWCCLCLLIEFYAGIRQLGIKAAAPGVVYICYALFSRIPLLGKALAYVGRHSLNIYLIHGFIYYVWFSDFIYSFKNPALMVLVLLALSLLVSILLELLKRLVRYDRLVERIRKRFDSRQDREEALT